MIRLLVLLVLLLIFGGTLWWLYRTVRDFRAGTLEPDVPGAVHDRHHARYEIVERGAVDAITIAVLDSHRREIRSWTVDMTVESALDDLHRARADARALHGELDV